MDRNEKHELAKTLFVNAMKGAENLGEIPKDDLKEALIKVAVICNIAADAFEEAKDNQE